MSLRERLVELFGRDLEKIDRTRVLIIGENTLNTYYTILSIISAGFGFQKEIVIFTPWESERRVVVYDWELNRFSDFEKMINKKFPGAKIEILEGNIFSIPTLVSLVKPDYVISVLNGRIIEKILKKEVPSAIIGRAFGDLEVVVYRISKPPVNLNLLDYNVKPGVIGSMILSNFIGGYLVSNVMGTFINTSYIKLGNGYGKKVKREDYLMVGCGAGANYTLEVLLNYVNSARMVLVDYDTIEEHNVMRQMFFDPEDEGKYKVDVLGNKLKKKARLLGINLDVMVIREYVSGETLEDIYNKVTSWNLNPEILIFSDNPAARYYTIMLGKKLGKKLGLMGGAMTGREKSTAIVIRDYFGKLLENKALVNEKNPERNPSIRPGGISFPHGVIGSINTLMLIYKVRGEVYVKIPFINKVEIFSGEDRKIYYFNVPYFVDIVSEYLTIRKKFNFYYLDIPPSVYRFVIQKVPKLYFKSLLVEIGNNIKRRVDIGKLGIINEERLQKTLDSFVSSRNLREFSAVYMKSNYFEELENLGLVPRDIIQLYVFFYSMKSFSKEILEDFEEKFIKMVEKYYRRKGYARLVEEITRPENLLYLFAAFGGDYENNR